MKTKHIILSFLLAGAAMIPLASYAADGIINVTAQNGAYAPAKIEAPAGQKVTLHVKNADSAVVEFESYPLNREVKIQPGEEKDIIIDAQKPGSYEFFDDNNPDAKGILVVK